MKKIQSNFLLDVVSLNPSWDLIYADTLSTV